MVGVGIKLKYFVRSAPHSFFSTELHKYCAKFYQDIQLVYDPYFEMEAEMVNLFDKIRATFVRKLAMCGYRDIYWKLIPKFTEPVVALVKGYQKNPSRSPSPDPSIPPEFESDVEDIEGMVGNEDPLMGYVPRSPSYSPERPYDPADPYYNPQDPWQTPASGTNSDYN